MSENKKIVYIKASEIEIAENLGISALEYQRDKSYTVKRWAKTVSKKSTVGEYVEWLKSPPGIDYMVVREMERYERKELEKEHFRNLREKKNAEALKDKGVMK